MIKKKNEAKTAFVDENSTMNARYSKELNYHAKDWVAKSLKNYLSFNGRARRREYWWTFLFIAFLSIIAAGLDFFVSVKTGFETHNAFYLISTLALITPLMAVGCRRLHDIGRSGWWQLLWAAPSLIAWLAVQTIGLYAISMEVAAVTLTVIITCWATITIMLLMKTSPYLNKYGLPAKRIGKKERLEK